MSMLDILKKLSSIEGKKPINESVLTECPPDMGPQQSNVNISVSGNSMADIMRALAGIEQSAAPRGDLMASPIDDPNIPGRDSVPGDDDMQDGAIGTAAGGALGALAGGPIGAGIGAVAGDALTGEAEIEEWDNEPDEDYRDHNFMTKDLSGGINRQKKMFAPAAKGDNPMAVESIKDRLYRALSEKKAKPDYLDMDKDGNKKEPMKKAVADKKKNPFAKTNEAKKAKPDYLDMDKDGNKKEPMKKAVADKKKVDENLNEGMRLVSKSEKGNRAVKIYKDSEWGEFVVKHFENGQYMQDADYFDSDKESVIGTAKHFLSGAQESVENESVYDKGGSNNKFLVYMQKDAMGGPGDKKYYVIDYNIKPGFVHHPQAMKKVFNDHPITQRLRSEGYVGPEMVSNLPDNMDAEIENAKKRIAQTEPHKDGFPVPYYDAVKRLKQLEKTKQLLASVPLVKEADISELSRDTLGKYAAKAHNRGDMAARMSKRGDGGGYDKDMSNIANKRYQGVQTAINKLSNRARVNPK